MEVLLRSLPNLLLKMCMWRLLATSLIIIDSHTAAEVTLVSIVEQDGRTAACPGEVVTFTCTVTQGAFLNWGSSAFTSCDSVPTYTLRSDTSVGSISICGSFQANLTAITNITQVGQALQADLTSTLSPTTTVSPGTVITCSDLPSTQSSSPSRVYPNTASLPSTPQSANTSTVQIGPNNITVLVQWSYPQSDGGVPVDNYTVILVGPGAVHFSTTTSVQPVATFTLALNEKYIVSVAATNCAGTGGTVSLNISQSEAGCGNPTPPVNGSIVEFVSAVVGSQILYSCDPGFLPEGLRTSMCSSNISWHPNPADFPCRNPTTCHDPIPPMKGSIGGYTSTVEGSVVAFHCNEGLIPLEQMNATCTSDGSWTPNPAELICNEPPSNTPRNDTSSIPASCSTSVAITAVVSCAVSFIIATLVGAVVHYCTVKKKCDCQKFYSLTIAHKQQQQQPAPMYDDIVGQSHNIELKENVAYGPVQQ